MKEYGYKIHIWRSVYHNNKFSHTSQRYVVQRRADKILYPKPTQFSVPLTIAKEIQVHDDLLLTTSEEYIHSVEFMGKMKWIQTYERRRNDYTERSNCVYSGSRRRRRSS